MHLPTFRLRAWLSMGLIAVAIGGCAVCAEDAPPKGDAAKEIPPLQDKSAEQKPHESLANGDLELGNAGKTGPAGWDLPDGLSTFWVADTVDGKTTHVWKIDTQVLEKEFLERRKAVQAALDAKQPIPAAAAKTPPTPAQQYECVGGTYGVQVYSEPVLVKPGASYRLRARVKGPESGKDATGNYFFFPRIFVKGYATVGGRERVSYKTYLACRLTKAETWTAFEMEIHPTKMVKTVEYMRVMIYCYWPLGTYEIDDLELTEVPAKAAAGAAATPEPTPAPGSEPPVAAPGENSATAGPPIELVPGVVPKPADKP